MEPTECERPTLDYQVPPRVARGWDVLGICSACLPLGAAGWFVFALLRAVDAFYTPFPNPTGSEIWAAAAYCGAAVGLAAGLFCGIRGRRRPDIDAGLSVLGMSLNCLGLLFLAGWVLLSL